MELLHQMEFHKMQANWWISCANNGHYKVKSGKVFNEYGEKVSDGYLKDRAMKTAQNHMRIYMECAETYQEQKETKEH